MLVVHTKFAHDRFFGLIKRIAVLSVTQQNDVKVIQSSTLAGGNTVQLTKDVNAKGKLC